MYTVLRHKRPFLIEKRWNACVKNSANPIIYGYTWYLDAVTNMPDWTWEGLIVPAADGSYEAAMPVPLRRKRGFWVVHQPLFCQFLSIFAANPSPELFDAFTQALLKQYRYGSVVNLQILNSPPPFPTRRGYGLPTAPFFLSSILNTHLLDLSKPYEILYRGFSPDTRRHLRQAAVAGWLVQESTDPRPLLALFRQHHASRIPGGVGDWAYALFEGLFLELSARGVACLRYAVLNSEIEAGAVFVRSDNCLIYLFNAATETGRRQHARTLLINQVIKEQAGRVGFVVDFESPEKVSVVRFYEGFGAKAVPYFGLRWNRFPKIVRWLWTLPKSR